MGEKKAFTGPAAGNNNCRKAEVTYRINAMKPEHGGLNKTLFQISTSCEAAKSPQWDCVKKYLWPLFVKICRGILFWTSFHWKGGVMRNSAKESLDKGFL